MGVTADVLIIDDPEQLLDLGYTPDSAAYAYAASVLYPAPNCRCVVSHLVLDDKVTEYTVESGA